VSKRRKNVKQSIEPLPNRKQPRGAGLVETISAGKFGWDTRRAEVVGAFSWKNCDHTTLLRDVVPKLQECQSLSWEKLGQNGSHQVLVSNLCKEAQERLKTHFDPDGNIDRLYSLRISGKQRIWGFRDRQVLYVLWWDPEHTVCKSQLKYT
jgi:hypothetical protein